MTLRPPLFLTVFLLCTLGVMLFYRNVVGWDPFWAGAAAGVCFTVGLPSGIYYLSRVVARA